MLGSPMTILIADDEPVSRRLLENYLQKWGHKVTVARDGLEAWQFFEKEDFPIVISDWDMPGLNGPDLIRCIRASSHAGYVYTILVTAKSQKEDVVEGLEAGADDFVSKPFDRDELRMRLHTGERIIRLERAAAANQIGKTDGSADEIRSLIDSVKSDVTTLRGELIEAVDAIKHQLDPPNLDLDLTVLRDKISSQCEKVLADIERASGKTKE